MQAGTCRRIRSVSGSHASTGPRAPQAVTRATEARAVAIATVTGQRSNLTHNKHSRYEPNTANIEEREAADKRIVNSERAGFWDLWHRLCRLSLQDRIATFRTAHSLRQGV